VRELDRGGQSAQRCGVGLGFGRGIQEVALEAHDSLDHAEILIAVARTPEGVGAGRQRIEALLE
jgi:hypothetical protein